MGTQGPVCGLGAERGHQSDGDAAEGAAGTAGDPRRARPLGRVQPRPLGANAHHRPLPQPTGVVPSFYRVFLFTSSARSD